MTYIRPYFDKDKTKFSHELCQILDEVTHGRPAFSSLWKLRPYVVGSVCSLGCSELGFSLVSERDSDSFPFNLLVSRILRRTAQRTAHYLYPFIFEGFPILSVEIYLIAEKPLGLHAEPFLIFLYMGFQVGRFVVGFPAVMVYKGETIYDADPNLCSEFNLGLGLAAYNRTDVWLMLLTIRLSHVCVPRRSISSCW